MFVRSAWGGATQDSTPPRIIALTPALGDTLVSPGGLSQVLVAFDEAVTVPNNAVEAWTIAAGTLPATATVGPQGDSMAITFSQAIQNDVLTLVIDYAITDLAGNELDGEVAHPSSGRLPSGDGRRGGQAVFRIPVLQGDVNRDGVVDQADRQMVHDQLGLCATPGRRVEYVGPLQSHLRHRSFDSRTDLNGDGCVNLQDLAILEENLGAVLPTPDGQPPFILSRNPQPSSRVRTFMAGSVTLTFSEPILPEHLTPRSFFVIEPNGELRAADSLVLSNGDSTLEFTFSPPLIQTGLYHLNLTQGVADASGGLLDESSLASWLTVLDSSPASIRSTSPINGEGEVALTRETIVRFSFPINPSSVSPSSISATFGGQALATRLHVAPDAESVTVFYVDPLPPSAVVRVEVRGDLLADDLDNPVDADNDGTPGGVGLLDFSTLTLTTLPGTRVFGRVFASELAGVLNQPLEGVTITVDGSGGLLSAVTDSLGNFCLDPAPVGTFFVEVNGRTAMPVGLPPGDYYPFVGKPWTSIAGQEVNVGDIYLPLIHEETLVPVSQTGDTTIPFPPVVIQEHPELAGVEITVPAGALFADDGTTGGMVGIAPVDPQRLPGPLPEGLDFELVITVQTSGMTGSDPIPTNFDRPVAVKFPNLPDSLTGVAPAPGSKRYLVSFNHDRGKWEPIGPMTVTPDGLHVISDPGVGILAPGWHGTTRSPMTTPPPPCGCCLPDDFLACGAASANDNRHSLVNAALRLIHAGGSLATGCTYVEGDCAHPRKPGVVEILWSHIIDWARLNNEGAHRDDDCIAAIGCRGFATASSLVHGGSNDPVIDSVLAIGQEIVALVAPYVRAGMNIPASAEAQVAALIADANMLANGDAQAYAAAALLELETADADFDLEFDGWPGNAPPHSVHYAALCLRDNGEVLEFRGKTEPLGQFSVFVPDDGTIESVLLYDALSNSVGESRVVTNPAAPFRLTRFYLEPQTDASPDFDGDALSDDAEVVLGTHTYQADTDGDGISDGAEVAQGTNPLDDLLVQTGVIATADTVGTATDICAINDRVIVADASGGVSVFNVFSGMNPAIIAQVDTPGVALSVACSGERIAVADGAAGLAVIDVQDAPAARIAYQLGPLLLGSDAQAVAAAGGIVYVGTTGGDVVAVDLQTGVILDRVTIGSFIHDLAIDGEFLFVLVEGGLHVVDIFDSAFPIVGFAASPGVPNTANGRMRLFVGGGTAYAVHRNGYNTLDVSNPRAPALCQSGATGQVGWKQIVANGAGLGVATVGANLGFTGPHDVSLYDVSDPKQTDVFLATLPTPGIARAVSLYNGLAYVADHENGLQVVNYLPYDNLSLPPTVTLSTNVIGGQVEEGTLILASVAVQDDVQVRNVELLIDDVVVQTDGNFPFQFFFNAPSLQSLGLRVPAPHRPGHARSPQGGSASFTVTVRASDTGGNRTTATPEVFAVLSDSSAPTVANASIDSGELVTSVELAASGISLRLSEPVDPLSVPGSIALTWAGPDDQFGTGDDALVPIQHSLVELDRRLVVAPMNAPSGALELRLDGALISDRAGNLLDGDGDSMAGGDFVLVFEAVDVTFTKSWVADANGAWSNGSNWSAGSVPGPSDAALINRPGDLTVSVLEDAATDRLYSFERMNLQGGTLSLLGTSELNRLVTLAGGNLTSAGALTVDAPLLLTSGNLSGTGHVSVRGPVTWQAGILQGPGTTSVTTAGSLLISSGGKSLETRLEAGGATNWVGGDFTFLGGTFVNLSTGVFSASANARILSGGAGTNLFRNDGAFNQLGGTNRIESGVPFDNSGAVSVQNGLLAINGGGTNTGTLTVQAPGTLSFGNGYDHPTGSTLEGAGLVEFNGGNHTFHGSFAPTGAVNFNQGTVTINNAFVAGGPVRIGGLSTQFNAPATLGALTLTGSARLEGSANTTIDGPAAWQAGSMRGTGRTIVSSTGSLTILAGDNSLHRTLENAGTTSWTGSPLAFVGGTILNQAGGVFETTANANMTVGGGGTNLVRNLGTFRHLGMGLSICEPGVPFQNLGTLEVIHGGLSLGGGGSNTGLLSASAGSTLYLHNSFALGSGSMRTELAGTAPTAIGQLQIFGGGALLSGTLEVVLAPGYSPSLGNTFDVLTFETRTGSFSSILLPALGPGLELTAQYLANSLRLTVVSVP